jgi:hypothetical protein
MKPQYHETLPNFAFNVKLCRHNKGKAMSTVHIMGLEHWAYRLAQQEGMACVYD